MHFVSFAGPPLLLHDRSFRPQLHAASRVLLDNRDVLSQRVWTAASPRWMRDTDLLDWLLSLTPTQVVACEELGLSRFVEETAGKLACPLPERLLFIAECAAGLGSCFPGNDIPPISSSKLAPKVRPAKHTQIGAVVSVVDQVLKSSKKPITRIVDVGGGHGHLSSSLAEASLPVDVVCLDCDERLLATGRFLQRKRRSSGQVRFVHRNAMESGSPVSEQDCVIGLHPCGSLGDKICIDAATPGGAGAVVMVPCCLHKLHQGLDVRYPLSAAGNENTAIREGLSFDRQMLGLANRVRGSGSDTTPRVTRVALRILLESRGLAVPAESRIAHGLSRHRMKRGLAAVADDALRLHGDSRAASDAEIEVCVRDAQRQYDRMRVLSLPRNELGMILEMAVVLDRASLLADSGRFASVNTMRLFPEFVSMRNLAIVAK